MIVIGWSHLLIVIGWGHILVVIGWSHILIVIGRGSSRPNLNWIQNIDKNCGIKKISFLMGVDFNNNGLYFKRP